MSLRAACRKRMAVAAALLTAWAGLAPWVNLANTPDLRPESHADPVYLGVERVKFILAMPLAEGFRLVGKPEAIDGDWGEIETVGQYFEDCYTRAVNEVRWGWGWKARDEAYGLAICVAIFGAHPPINEENTPGIMTMLKLWEEAAEFRRAWHDDPAWWLALAPVIGVPVHRDSTVGGMAPYYDYISGDLTTGGLPTPGAGLQWCEGYFLNRWIDDEGNVPATRISHTDPIDGATTVYMDEHTRGRCASCRLGDVGTFIPGQMYVNRGHLRTAWKEASDVVVTADTRTTRYVRPDGVDTASGVENSADPTNGAKLTVAGATALITGDNWKIVLNGLSGSTAIVSGGMYAGVRRGILITGINGAILSTANAGAFGWATGGSQWAIENIAYVPASGASNRLLRNNGSGQTAKCYSVHNCTGASGGGTIAALIEGANGTTAYCDGLGMSKCSTGVLTGTAFAFYSELTLNGCCWGVDTVDMGTGYSFVARGNQAPATSTTFSLNYCTAANAPRALVWSLPFCTINSFAVSQGAIESLETTTVNYNDTRFERCKFTMTAENFEVWQDTRTVSLWGCYITRPFTAIGITGSEMTGLFVRGCIFDCGSANCLVIQDPTSGANATNVVCQTNTFKTSGIPLVIAPDTYTGYAFDGNCYTASLATYCTLNGVGQNQAAWTGNAFVGVSVPETFETQASFNATTLEPSGSSVLTSGYPAVMGGGTTFAWRHFYPGATTCPSGGWSGAPLAPPTVGSVAPADGALSIAYTPDGANPTWWHYGDVSGESDETLTDAASPVSVPGTNEVLLYTTPFSYTTAGAMSLAGVEQSGTPAPGAGGGGAGSVGMGIGRFVGGAAAA